MINGLPWWCFFIPNLAPLWLDRRPVELTPDMFSEELGTAVEAFDKYVVCLDKSPDECRASLESLLDKAIAAYISRAPGLRHGIALDTQVTIILSQVDGEEQPLCGIYFNLHSPYKQTRQPANN
ncbi:MAG: hypothetical protein VX705_09980 [Verrucomicrobiota bacterium]|nr:hypothetical protein [Verrucomicrobiota bacterium]